MITPVCIIHGGAGTILRTQISAAQEAACRSALEAILRAAQQCLSAGGSALDTVELAVSLLEDCELFNAGKGSVYTAAGTHEMDAAIMDGRQLAAGAVAGVSRLRNPVRAARLVMEKSPHVLLAGAGAEAFAREHGAEFAEPSYFHTDFRYQQWLQARQQNAVTLDHQARPIDENRKMGTVGAVALDQHGNLAAATSTGGMTNKLAGRIGDTPIPGAGCYADNRTAALSATGTGEAFIRSVALHDISARMRYLNETLTAAASQVVMHSLPAVQGSGGIIGISATGEVCLCFNSEGMYRGVVRGDSTPEVAIYRDN
ncbi:isoaspartyl peptidase/L-asparaginase family protein [Undibacterium squillarum]|uniref:isoaspartyl peptidase/L-asparaginase family protein n=1 Tax=Undibacterium squillarum TaxID=1131567 RepID=UPI0035B38B07